MFAVPWHVHCPNGDNGRHYRFGIEVKNLRTITSCRILYGIAFGLKAVDGVCGACDLWRGESQDNPHRKSPRVTASNGPT